jgi:hypothetical protein
MHNPRNSALIINGNKIYMQHWVAIQIVLLSSLKILLLSAFGCEVEILWT